MISCSWSPIVDDSQSSGSAPSIREKVSLGRIPMEVRSGVVRCSHLDLYAAMMWRVRGSNLYFNSYAHLRHLFGICSSRGGEGMC